MKYIVIQEVFTIYQSLTIYIFETRNTNFCGALESISVSVRITANLL